MKHEKEKKEKKIECYKIANIMVLNPARNI